MNPHMHQNVSVSTTEKRERLAKLLSRRAAQQVTVSPLSHGQKALWFLYQSAPESAAYHIAHSVRMRSIPDVEALRRSLQALTDRHAMLRATFKRCENEVVQEIPGHRDVCFEIRDCTGLRPEKLYERVAAAYRRPFDLERGPVFRAELFTCAPNDHVFLMTIHHIVYDGWSLWRNVDELRRLYAAEVSGTQEPLPAVTGSYPAYVRRQADMLAGPEGERLWNFWEHELAGAAPVLDLPLDRPRPLVQTYNGASHRFRLDAELTRRLKTLAQAQGVTPFMLLLASFQLLLSRYSGQDQIVVGSPTAGRGNGDDADVVGYFVNPIVLKADLSHEPSVQAFIQQVRQTVLRAFEHQSYPFPLLVERLQPARDASYSPLFQVSFVLQKAQCGGSTIDLLARSEEHGARYNWGGLDVEYFDLPQQEGQFDLELEMLEAGSVFFGNLKYNTDLFEPTTIERLARHFTRLVESVLDAPEQSVGKLELLNEEECRSLLDASGAVTCESAETLPIHRLFEHQVQKRPEAIAVTCEGRSLTYRGLNERANCLAHYLKSLGVGPEVLVGLWVERSLEMIVAILGILKAGGAYLPLDPASPKEQLAFIVADSGVRVLVTEEALAKDLPCSQLELICIDADWPAISKESCENPSTDLTGENLAYVIYTSGSTGKPKGCEISHHNVVRLFTATDDWYHIDHRDVWTVFHSVAFDFSVWEIWGALLYGGRLVVVPYWISRSPGEFLELLAAEQVTVLNQTPSAFGQLMQAEARMDSSKPLALRLVIFGGEALDVQSLKPWFDRHGDVCPQLVNMYGITETTVHVTYRPLTRHDLSSNRSVIGVPLPDLSLYLLDRYLQPVPIGVVGEVYVGGAGVARGYRNRPELTRDRFIEDPFSSHPGARLYKTGDLARRRVDGDVEYVGRLDNQVKIRGFRIELGEIEAVLGEHPAIERAVVTVQAEVAGDKRLVAYIVGRQGQKPVGGELRHFLTERLPIYMVPVAYVPIAQLPLTNNGKVDYRALPAVDDGRGETGQAYIPPRDVVEQKLVRLWEGVLNFRPVGVRDNFFELGGHSLLAVHLMAEIQRDFGAQLPLATLFRNPTVEQLGALLRSETASMAWSPLVPIQPVGAGTPFFCIAGGGGSVLYFYQLAHRLGQERPFYGLQGIGLDGECEPLDRAEAIAARYVEALQSVQPHGPYLLGGHCFGGLVAFEVAQQLQKQGETVRLVALLDVPAPHRAPDEVRSAGDDDPLWLARLAGILTEASGKELGIGPAELRGLDAEAQLACFQEKMQAVGLLPPGASVAQIRGMLGVFVANSQIRYSPSDVRPVRLALFKAREPHPEYDFSNADDSDLSTAESTLGWGQFAAGQVAVYGVPGNHITMMNEPNVQVLAESLGQRLREADTQSHQCSPTCHAKDPHL
jgi:amino acid adenylation domain-containing protein